MTKQKKRKAKFTRGFLNFTEKLAYLAINKKLSPQLNRKKDIAYSDSKMTKYDITFNPTATEPQPIMIYIHGGGFISGDKKIRQTYCARIAELGYTVFNVNYTLAPDEIFPHQICELFKAIEHIIDRKDEYNLDTSRIVLGGESAGAYFVSYLTIMSQKPELFDQLGISFAYKDLFKVKACLLMCGAMDLESLVDSKFPYMKKFLECFIGKKIDEIKAQLKDELYIMNPFNYIDSNFPPSVVIRAKKDLLRVDSVKITELFDSLGVSNLSLLTEGYLSMHAFALACDTKRGKDCFNQSFDFINKIIFTKNKE